MTFFTCKNCGSNVIGYKMKKRIADKKYRPYPKYVCSNYYRKGPGACDKHVYVNKEWIENKVIDEIDQRYNSEEVI
jgi:hypothetical protein